MLSVNIADILRSGWFADYLQTVKEMEVHCDRHKP
jgi:hypothetical protein